VAAELAENVLHEQRRDKADKADRNTANRSKNKTGSDKGSRDSATGAETPPLNRGYAEVTAGKGRKGSNNTEEESKAAEERMRSEQANIKDKDRDRDRDRSKDRDKDDDRDKDKDRDRDRDRSKDRSKDRDKN
jgi:hypothetical protein